MTYDKANILRKMKNTKNKILIFGIFGILLLSGIGTGQQIITLCTQQGGTCFPLSWTCTTPLIKEIFCGKSYCPEGYTQAPYMCGIKPEVCCIPKIPISKCQLDGGICVDTITCPEGYWSTAPSAYGCAFNCCLLIPTTTTTYPFCFSDSDCMWCGQSCERKIISKVCVMITPPEGYECKCIFFKDPVTGTILPGGGKCQAVPISTTTTTIPQDCNSNEFKISLLNRNFCIPTTLLDIIVKILTALGREI